MGDEDHVAGYGLTGDQDVELRTEYLHLLRGSNAADLAGFSLRPPRQFGHWKQQRIDERDVVVDPPALECAVEEFVGDNRRDRHIARSVLLCALAVATGGNAIPQHGDDGVRVEKPAHQQEYLVEGRPFLLLRLLRDRANKIVVEWPAIASSQAQSSASGSRITALP